MTIPVNHHRFERSQELAYLLRRAEQESIAAIRSGNAMASSSHARMAQAYSALATSLLDDAEFG